MTPLTYWDDVNPRNLKAEKQIKKDLKTRQYWYFLASV